MTSCTLVTLNLNISSSRKQNKKNLQLKAEIENHIHHAIFRSTWELFPGIFGTEDSGTNKYNKYIIITDVCIIIYYRYSREF